MNILSTSSVLGRQSYAKTKRKALTHKGSILGAKVYNKNRNENNKLWLKIKDGKKEEN